MVSLDKGKPSSLPYGLTRREVEVLQLLAEGLTNAQIAKRLVLSTLTINTYLRTIYGKLEVTSRSAATRRTLELGL
jgi:DNA-binding NarL/FixJ family response regulator